MKLVESKIKAASVKWRDMTKGRVWQKNTSTAPVMVHSSETWALRGANAGANLTKVSGEMNKFNIVIGL